MKTIMKPRLAGALVAIAAIFSLNGVARADHDYQVLRAKADAVYHSMLDLDRTFVSSYYRSRAFGDLMSTSAQIKSKATYLRGMAWRGSTCQWSSELDRLDVLVHDLENLVDNAHARADRRLDPPIAACRVTMARKLNALVELVHCMQEALVLAPPVPQPPVVVVPEPYYGDSCYRNPYDSGYYRGNGNGYYNSYGNSGYRSGGYGGYGHDGIRIDGPRNGGVKLDSHGVTIGKGGLSFRINF